MLTASSFFDPDCGSRHGIGRIRTVAEPSTAAWVSGRRISSAVDIGLRSRRLRLHFELGVAQSAHFRHIQTSEFSGGAHALTEERIDDPVDDEAEAEHETDKGRAADQLSYQLAGIAVEQPFHGAVHAVPRATVITLAVGE